MAEKSSGFHGHWSRGGAGFQVPGPVPKAPDLQEHKPGDHLSPYPALPLCDAVPRTWSRFVVSANDLLRDLGLDARRKSGLTRSNLLKEIGKWPFPLGLAQCEGGPG
ncbi:hypothetical protein OMCYN_01780 [cyanobiont of Ornithocercus magnificus]|nr:hypothetical protein OMCYN_01780 [cyanobiont of Ornithocercus magnificus]